MLGRSSVYTVATVSPEAVREDLLRVWGENLTLGMSPEAKFKHLYQDAPDAAAEVFVLRARDADAVEERVVGAQGINVRRYWWAGREVRAAIACDFAVDATHRQLLPALRLARLTRDHMREDFDLGYGFPNAKAAGVVLRAGFRMLGKMSRHVRVLRPSRYLARIRHRRGATARLFAHPSIAHALDAIAFVAWRALMLVPAWRAAWGHRLTWSLVSDTAIDALWEAARHEYTIVGTRTSALLAWRFPGTRIARLTNRQGDLRAYALIEVDPATQTAHLRDLFGFHDAFEPLLDLLLPSLSSQGVASVSASFLGAPQLRQMLAHRGFFPRGEGRLVVVAAGDEAPEGVQAIRPEAWHLFDVDEDA